MAANRDEKSPFDDLISVREAARILHVSESTVWRWIGRGILKAHRVGPKRVCLRREELEPVLKPVPAGSIEDESAEAREQRLRSYLRPMSAGPKRPIDEVFEDIRRINAEIVKRRGGLPLPESWLDINEMREERYNDL
jgi:excisionase family DNA binding protein